MDREGDRLREKARKERERERKGRGGNHRLCIESQSNTITPVLKTLTQIVDINFKFLFSDLYRSSKG